MTTEQEFAGWADSTIIANYSRTKDIRCIEELERRSKSRGAPVYMVNAVVVDSILAAMGRGEQN